MESQSSLSLSTQPPIVPDSSVFLYMANLELSSLNAFKDDVASSTTHVSQAAVQVTSYSYYDGQYSEQEIAVYEHEDEATKSLLISQIEANKARIQHLDSRLEMMLKHMDNMDQRRRGVRQL